MGVIGTHSKPHVGLPVLYVPWVAKIAPRQKKTKTRNRQPSNNNIATTTTTINLKSKEAYGVPAASIEVSFRRNTVEYKA